VVDSVEMSEPRALLISARMGQGHDGVTRVMAGRLGALGIRCEVRDLLDASPRLGELLETGFKLEVERAPWIYQVEFWLWNRSPTLMSLTRKALKLFFWRRVAEWISATDPDLVVALHPFAAQLLGHMRRIGHPAVASRPIATFLTDYSVHPLWVHPAVDMHLCVSTTAATEARTRAGAAGDIVVTGPFIDDRFFHPPSREEARRLLGLPGAVPIALVVGGSWGVGAIEETARALAEDPDTIIVVLCGRNEALLERLGRLERCVPVGWTDRVVDYLAASDVVIQNAGGLSALEAMAARRPVISYRPIPGHGIENVRAMASVGATVWCRDAEELRRTVRALARHPERQLAHQDAQLTDHPEAAIVTLLHRVRLKHRSLAGAALRRGARVLAAAIVLFVLGNLLSGVIGYRGLNLARTAASSHYLYLAVLPSPSALSSPRVWRAISSHDLGLVATRVLATTDPSGLRGAAASGDELINGGTGHSTDFDFLLPANDLSSGRSAIAAVTGEEVNDYLPQNTMNAIDLAWASLHHQSVIPATILRHVDHLVPKPGAIFELNLSGLDAQATEIALQHALRRLAAAGYSVVPFSTLNPRTAP
jgi:processive 1,2-diacylglycerol beta-glucosyltransferase